jgi:hypothetical protein
LFKFGWNFINPKTSYGIAEERIKTSIRTIRTNRTNRKQLSSHLGKLNVTYGLTRRRQRLNYRVFPGQGRSNTQTQTQGQQQDHQYSCGPHNATPL